ncbi:MAG: hypothetical protein PHQ72_08615 [Hespellia sp.]|nr:hypothetical protein [Hespellia sp.]
MVDKYNAAHPNATADFPKISNHIFRHTGCTKYCESGEIDLNVMVKLMGHADAKQILKPYDSVSQEGIQRQVAKAC